MTKKSQESNSDKKYLSIEEYFLSLESSKNKKMEGAKTSNTIKITQEDIAQVLLRG